MTCGVMLPLAALLFHVFTCSGVEIETSTADAAAFSVDFDGQTREMRRGRRERREGEASDEGLEPLSLTEIMPHWSDDALQEHVQHHGRAHDPPAQADVEGDDGEAGGDGGGGDGGGDGGDGGDGDSESEEEDSEESETKKDFSFSYHQAVTGSTPTGPLGIGTPSVGLNMILDTGSDKFVAKTWSTIKAELDKIDAGASADIYPTSKIYNHNTSKSYIQLFASQNGKKVPRQGFIAYGSGMAITLEGRETIRIGDGEKAVSMQKFPISEISLDSLQILHSSKGISGILGLQHMMNRSLGQSFYSVLRDKGVLHSFGYCRGKDNDGTFIWGDQSSEGKAVPVAGQMHWAVLVRNMHVQKPRHHSSFIERYEARISESGDAKNHSRLHKFSLCRKSHCVAVIDTGSNIIAMPSEAVRTLSKVLDVATDCSNMNRLPNLHFVLGEDMHISLPPSAYVMKVKLPSLKEKKTSSESSSSESSESSSEEGEADAQSAQSLRDRERHGVLAEMQQTQLDSLVEDTYREHGLDLRVLRVDLVQALRNSSTLCMPAIVPLDRETQRGSLLVIGGPLFEKYYTRWSWPKGQKPQVYVKSLSQAEACKAQEEEQDDDEEEVSTKKAQPKMTVWRNHEKSGRMIRSEKPRRRIAELNEMSSGHRVREMKLEEIRYPHWAKYIEDL